VQDVAAQAAGVEQDVGDDVQAARGAPVGHAHGVAVAHVDEVQLLEALDRLADRRRVEAVLAGQRALRRSFSPGA
jgi:hypothetical protein